MGSLEASPWLEDRGHDISWEECIAVELLVIWLCEKALHDCDVTICSDNASFMAACWKGCSCNPSQNNSIWRITVALSCSNILISPIYVSPAENKVDPLSRSSVMQPAASKVQSLYPLASSPSFTAPESPYQLCFHADNHQLTTIVKTTLLKLERQFVVHFA